MKHKNPFLLSSCVIIFTSCAGSCDAIEDWTPESVPVEMEHQIPFATALNTLQSVLDAMDEESTILGEPLHGKYIVARDAVFIYNRETRGTDCEDTVKYYMIPFEEGGYALVAADERMDIPVAAIVNDGMLDVDDFAEALYAKEEPENIPEVPESLKPVIEALADTACYIDEAGNLIAIWEEGDSIRSKIVLEGCDENDDEYEENSDLTLDESPWATRSITGNRDSWIASLISNTGMNKARFEGSYENVDPYVAIALLSIDDENEWTPWSLHCRRVATTRHRTLTGSFVEKMDFNYHQHSPFNDNYPNSRRKYLICGPRKRPAYAGCATIAMLALLAHEKTSINGFVPYGGSIASTDNSNFAQATRSIDIMLDTYHFQQGTFCWPNKFKREMEFVFGWAARSEYNHNSIYYQFTKNHIVPVVAHTSVNLAKPSSIINWFKKSHYWVLTGGQRFVRSKLDDPGQQQTFTMVYCDWGKNGKYNGWYADKHFYGGLNHNIDFYEY